MPNMGPELVFVAYGLSLLVLSTFGLNRYILVSLFRRRQRHETAPSVAESDLPSVTVQLPIYNELYVVERLIRSACELDYPRRLLEIQVLDDSTDETLEIARRLVRSYQKAGVNIVHIHRKDRLGFKGGALAHGLERARGEFVAVFDADFLIPRNFLRDTVPHFTSDDVGMVQTRWTYLNDDYSILTRAAALGLDGHFVVEQSARYWGGLFMNFNGTAGIWRARCIHEAGGWQHDTLTEDLDLSYRAQLAGWKFKYLWDVTCESEIPAEIHGMKTQQFRWTKGSMETARKVLPRLWRAELPLWIKTQGTLHLMGNIVFPFFLTIGLLNLPIVLISNAYDLRLLWPVSAYFLFTLFGTFSYYWTAQRATKMNWRRRAAYFPLFLGASIGLGVYNSQAALEGLFGRKSPFVRTPKYSLVGKWRSWRDRHYRSPVTWSIAGELLLGLYTLATIVVAIHLHEYGALPFLFLFAFGYLLVAGYSLKHMAVGGDRRLEGRVQLNGDGTIALSAGFLDSSEVGELAPAPGASRRRQESVARTLSLLLLLPLGSGCDGTESRDEAPVVLGDMAPAAEQSAGFPESRPDGFQEIGLAQKGRGWRVISPEEGGAHGTFWFRPQGEPFEWFVQGHDLTPGRSYRLVLNVDGTQYAIASLLADARGELRGYGALDAFGEQICVAKHEFDEPRPLTGNHEIGVWVQDDGARRKAGSQTRGLPTQTVHRQLLPCSGNGDGSYDFRLMEMSTVRFHGG